MKTRQQR